MRTFRLTSRTMPLSLVAVPVRAILLTACSSPSPAAPSVATFEVEGQEFKIELDTAELVQNAQDLLDDKEAPSIPVGNIVRNDPSINTPWSPHSPETDERCRPQELGGTHSRSSPRRSQA